MISVTKKSRKKFYGNISKNLEDISDKMYDYLNLDQSRIIKNKVDINIKKELNNTKPIIAKHREKIENIPIKKNNKIQISYYKSKPKLKIKCGSKTKKQVLYKKKRSKNKMIYGSKNSKICLYQTPNNENVYNKCIDNYDDYTNIKILYKIQK